MTPDAPRTDQKDWSTRRLLAWTAAHLERKGVDAPRLAAELLLAHVLEKPRIELFMDMDRPASPLERAAYRDLVERAAEHHPIQYLIGQTHFFSLPFWVDPRVLIPRPCTETLVEHVVQKVKTSPGYASPLIADIGTGSGAIAVALAKNLPSARVIATDLSADALTVARANAERHGVTDRVEFREGSLLEPLAGDRPAFIVSNPPYIPDEEWPDVAANVKDHEPAGALRGGVEGVDVIEPLIRASPDYLAPHAQLVVEIAASRRRQVLQLAEQTPGLANSRVLADHEGLPRMLLADRTP